MKKLYRLLKAEDFKSVLDKRKCIIKNDSLSLYYAHNDLPHTRIGISVSNKLGNAVVRVKIRRQVRAIIASIDKDLDVYNRHIDVVIICRMGFKNTPFIENYKYLLSAFTSLAQ